MLLVSLVKKCKSSREGFFSLPSNRSPRWNIHLFKWPFALTSTYRQWDHLHSHGDSPRYPSTRL